MKTPHVRTLVSILCASISSVALAQTEIQPASSGALVRWESNGNVTLNGSCFGGVSSLPTGEVVTFFNGKGAAKDGNLYFLGSINFNSVTFPDALMVRNGTTVLASVTSAGDFFLKGKCVNTAGCSNTVWEPSRWNDDSYVQGNNNCYNYGNDKITNTFAQPGQASGHPNNIMQVDPVRSAALWDGLRWVGWSFPGNTYDCGDGHLVFMTIAPDYDYHWMRLDQTRGVWSHKPGDTEATDLDSSGHTITNPLIADRNVYTENGGFYCTCGGLANIN
jgi:hypothetical protein